MTDTGSGKSKTDSLDSKQGDRREARRTEQRGREQDLNQGMATGTQNSVRTGVDWGSADQGASRHARSDQSSTTKEGAKKSETSTVSKKPRNISSTKKRTEQR